MQTTAQSIRAGLEKAMIALAEGFPRRRAGRHRPKYSGDALRAIRARNGVGRPLKPIMLFSGNSLGKTSDFHQFVGLVEGTMGPMKAAQVKHGSQRKAALALGLNLSTFQRRLAKEAA